MFTYEQLQALLKRTLQELDYPGRLPELYAPVQYILDLGGKRLRPLLVLMGANLYTDDLEEALQAALGIELFHNFTLMHDDIMDQAPLRRGRETVHEKWNKNTAILSGDVMLVEAYKCLNNARPQHVQGLLKLFNKVATEVCEGQQVDMNFEQTDKVSLEEYLDMITLKTAVLVGTCVQIGSYLGGADPENAGRAYDFGKNLGIAFQLQDDYLDVYGDPAVFGKKIGGDILANKKTILLVDALTHAKSKDAAELNGWLHKVNPDPEEKIAAVTAIYDHLETPLRVQDRIRSFTDQSFRDLDAIDVPAERKQVLRQTAENLMQREQ